MKIAVIDSRIRCFDAVCKFVTKGDEVIVLKKNASYGKIPLCLANAKIVVNEIPA
ncbi:hypothetical protein [uncultured Aquimarina sp.]|uniref:hypothetical protein n=1 Tax=uncultured Aquimarina sp. TaxID=575652 RepID=UPI0026293FD2|nr:hypothetical protein [uncultured Aquimarina sp.]